MTGRIISELICEKNIKSYYSGKFARKRGTGKVPRKCAVVRPKDWKSNKPGEVVQIDTMYLNVSNTTEYIFHIYAIRLFFETLVVINYCRGNGEEPEVFNRQNVSSSAIIRF